jgi:hypothetical protein
MMRFDVRLKFALGALSAAAVLSGCGSVSSYQTPLANAPAAANATLAGETGAETAARKARLLSSLIADRAIKPQTVTRRLHDVKPNCCAQIRTMFITDFEANAVQMFDFPSDAYIGQLSPPPEGFSAPAGACSDAKGNVYVTNSLKEAIDEFTHSGKYVKTLHDKDEEPIDCAVDPASGKLAVSNITTTSGGPGDIAIYSPVKDDRTVHADPGIQQMLYIGFRGNTGVLYIDGQVNRLGFYYASLSDGEFTNIKITGGNIGYPGSVVYSDKTGLMNVGDQSNKVLYHVSPAGHITGATQLLYSGDIIQGTIKGPSFIGPDVGTYGVETYAYPQGGNAQSKIYGYFKEPFGSAISTIVPKQQ